MHPLNPPTGGPISDVERDAWSAEIYFPKSVCLCKRCPRVGTMLEGGGGGMFLMQNKSKKYISYAMQANI